MSELIPSLNIDDFIAKRNRVEELLREAKTLVGEADAIVNEIALRPNDRTGQTDLGYAFAQARRDLIDQKSVEAVMHQLDARLWDVLMGLSGMRAVMSAPRRNEWHAAVDKANTPPLTKDNILSTFQELRGRRREMFNEGVVNVFRGVSWDYKSNSPVMLAPTGRIIMRSLMERSLVGGWPSWPSHHSANMLDDLERVLCAFDGKPEPDNRNGWWQRIQAVTRESGVREASSEYLRVKWFKNGNGHIYVLDPALLARMNQIIAEEYPGALPAHRDDD